MPPKNYIQNDCFAPLDVTTEVTARDAARNGRPQKATGGPGPLTQLCYPTRGPGGGNGGSGGEKYRHPTTTIAILSTITPYEILPTSQRLPTGSEARRRVLPNLGAVR